MYLLRSLTRPAVPLAAALLLAGLAGCDDNAGGGATPSPAPSGTVAPSAIPSPGTSPGRPTPTGPVGTYQGLVTAGVEYGCQILRTASGSYVLVGNIQKLRNGTRVTVRGIVATDTASVCGQGQVLRVVQVVAP